MEPVLWIVGITAAFLFLFAGINAWQGKRRRDKAAQEQRAMMQNVKPMVNTVPPSEGPFVRTGRSYASRSTNASSFTPQQPQVVHVDNGNPLLYGAIGYMLASSGSSHAKQDQPASYPDAERSSGSSSGSDHSSSYDYGGSSSSDSGSSSYDSGSSYSGGGDSGGGGGGGE